MKALYDYEAVAPGELSVQENDILLVFETEEDWLLVQDSQVEGRAGYVPGNYVEVTDEEVNESTATPNRIVVPDSVNTLSVQIHLHSNSLTAPETRVRGSR